VSRLRARFGLRRLAHHNPPMGFIRDPAAIAACLDFVRRQPARYILLCVGSPQQEMLAAQIAAAEGTTGIGLCVGSALDFVAGVKRRAPVWMQRAHLEWLHRLAREPGRLWRRTILGFFPLVAVMRKVPRQSRGWWRG
jgi:exopolysaccharide biosynthesis WecB/TagA/CpsF family protein